MIPCLSVEYFNEKFLHKIGERIGEVVKVDHSMAYVERGKFIIISIEVDFSNHYYQCSNYMAKSGEYNMKN